MSYERGDGQLEGLAGNALGRRQRDLLQEVEKQGGACDLVRVARRLAAAEPGHEPTPIRTRRIYTGLYNDHLQGLVDSGLVEYCEEEGVVRLTARGRALVADGH